MGTIYCGPYADAIDAYSHEGYGARILPNGTETAAWTYETREFRHYVARCDCGWKGTLTYPPTDAGYELAMEEWDRDHLQPMLNVEAAQHTIPASRLLAFMQELRQMADQEHRDGGHNELTPRGHGLCDAAEWLAQLLDSEASTP